MMNMCVIVALHGLFFNISIFATRSQIRGPNLQTFFNLVHES